MVRGDGPGQWFIQTATATFRVVRSSQVTHLSVNSHVSETHNFHKCLRRSFHKCLRHIFLQVSETKFSQLSETIFTSV